MSATTFIKKTVKDLAISKEEQKKLIRKAFLRYCAEEGVCNSIQAYRKYRAACRGAFGFDLPVSRPMKAVAPIEVETTMF